MGVDFFIIKAFGFVFPVTALSEEQREVISGLFYYNKGTRIEYQSQDRYGNQERPYVPHGFLFDKDNREFVYEGKVGGTPLSMINTGVYEQTQNIRGGAIIPFAVRSQEPNEDEHLPMLESIRKVDPAIAKVVEQHGVYGQWIFSYYF